MSAGKHTPGGALPAAPFTPGPLHVTREIDSEGECRHSVRTVSGVPLAVLSNYNAHEQKGNALLYAASPELLECLKNAAMNATGQRRARYLSAIAKATGAAS